MLYVLYGNDIGKARAKANTLVESLLSKKPDATLVRVTEEEFSPLYLETCILGQGLFESKLIIVLDLLLVNKEAQEYIKRNISELGTSQNIFILLEDKIEKKLLTKLEKHAEKVQACNLEKGVENNTTTFNVFALSDALGERNAKKLWTLYQKGKLHNVAPEDMHGVLLWEVRALLLVGNTKSPKETGLHPFVYRKATSFAQNYSMQELREISRRLVSIYHDARRGAVQFDIALETLILSL